MNFFFAARRLRAAVESVLASMPVQTRSIIERVEPRLLFSALDGSEVVGLPSDMKTSLYTFIGDHSGSNSEKWNMTVGGHLFSAPGYGVVQSDLTEYKKGETYPITVNWNDSNNYVDGTKTPDYDYRAWVDKSANPNWTSGPTTVSGPTYFATDPGSLLQKQWFDDNENHENATLGKMAYLNFPALDLDIDSNNDGGFAVPTNDLADDIAETVADSGKLLGADNGDADEDEVPDFADFDGSTGLKFVPLTLHLSGNLEDAGISQPIKLRFEYDASDPAAMTGVDTGAYKPDSGGSLRIWKKDGSATRSVTSDFIPEYSAQDASTEILASDIGLEPGGTVTLYVEAVANVGQTRLSR